MNDTRLKIHADGPVLLLGGSTLDLNAFHAVRERSELLIAADGGANHLLGSGLVPDAIVGDLDSLMHVENWRRQSQLVHCEEQESTDFEKCLYTVKAPWYWAMGFSGQRLDHSLAVLHSLARYVNSRRVLLLSDTDVSFVCRGDISLELPLSARLSVFPITPTRFVRSSGLSYPLDGLTLCAGEQIGCSNAVAEPQVQIEVETLQEGVYVVIAGISCLPAFEQFLNS